MNRPSLYGAFATSGVYLKALDAIGRARPRGRPPRRSGGEHDLRERCAAPILGARHLSRGARAGRRLFPDRHRGYRGGPGDKIVRESTLPGLHELTRLRRALSAWRGSAASRRRCRPRRAGAPPSAVLHTLSLRARAGETREALERTAEAGVALLCGAG